MRYKRGLGILLTIFGLGFIAIYILRKESPEQEEIVEFFHDSFREAMSECEDWKRKGGKWQLKVLEYGISVEVKKESELGPISIEKINPIPEDDPAYKKSNDEFAVKIPLLRYGEAKAGKEGLLRIKERGYTYIDYNLRLCRRHLVQRGLIVGEEYIVDKNSKYTEMMPSLILRKRYQFDE